MSLLNKLERKFKKYEIKHFSYVIMGIALIGAIIGYMTPSGFYSNYMSLNFESIFHGQIWRIITFLFVPRSGILFLILELYFYYWLGETLEQEWGAFKFNVFYFFGIIVHILVAMLIYLIFGVSYELTITYLNMAMFLTFVTLFPDLKLLWMFIIPIKTKWIGIIDAIYLGWVIIKGFMPTAVMSVLPSSMYFTAFKKYYLTAAISALISVIIYLIFNYEEIKTTGKNARYRKNRYQKNIRAVKKAANVENTTTRPFHECEICHRTNLTNPELEFRYCSKCDGMHEYCSDHIFTHKHIKNEENN